MSKGQLGKAQTIEYLPKSENPFKYIQVHKPSYIKKKSWIKSVGPAMMFRLAL